ncbi:uncharacterized protein LOC113338918 [Papaver somniferum]|uniref:uncharacterized protein LOC113338918 n=1 Tax=Papaver somniferum TaxID=3469 RepID=UPI000E6FB458|nr:uncharacterized protein LOC113338918 [Papaver somniferum]
MQNLMQTHNEHSVAVKVVGGYEDFLQVKRALSNRIFPILIHHIETNATFQVIQMFLKHKSDKEFILAHQPWIAVPLVIFCEDWNFFVQHPLKFFKFSPFWLQVLNLPRLFNDEEAIKDIIERSGTGTVLQLDLESSPPRALVMMDLNKPFMPGVMLSMGKGVWIQFAYENIPVMCFFCGFLYGFHGHTFKECKKSSAVRLFPDFHFAKLNARMKATTSIGNRTNCMLEYRDTNITLGESSSIREELTKELIEDNQQAFEQSEKNNPTSIQ